VWGRAPRPSKPSEARQLPPLNVVGKNASAWQIAAIPVSYQAVFYQAGSYQGITSALP